MTVRPATAADVGSIAVVESRCTAAPWTPEMVAGTLAQPTIRAFVACEDDIVVGHVLASAVDGAGEIVLVAVDPAFRRRGIGHALLSAAEAAWKAASVTEAFLEVRADNAAAMGLYAQRGWEPVAVRRGYYRDGADARVLRWRADGGAS